MRILALVFLVFGIALAAGGAYFASEHFRRLEAQMAQTEPKPQTVRVAGVKARLQYGDEITIKNADTLLRWVNWPADSVPQGVFYRVEDLFGSANDEKRIVIRTIEPGELLLTSKISGFGQDVSVAAQVTPGKRAFTIPIDAVRGVAGFVTAGDRVDILLTRTINREPTTSVILQDVPVIATDQRTDKENTRARLAKTATVEVDPRQAAKLTLAQSVGKLTLTLRGVDEATDQDVTPVRLQDLPAQPLPRAVRPTNQVRVRRAGQAEVIKVD